MLEDSRELTRGHKKKARTRQKLLEAALRIYARKGVGELALNELAEEAEVSNGTVYNYFSTREEVQEAVGRSLAEQLAERIDLISGDVPSGAERVSIGVRTFIVEALKNPDWARALLNVYHYVDAMRSALAIRVRNDLRSAHEQGEFNYANEDIALMLVLSSTMGAMMAIVEKRHVRQHDVLVAEMILLSLGVTPRKAHRIAHLPMPTAPALTPDEQI